jgi:hypothetical protein
MSTPWMARFSAACRLPKIPQHVSLSLCRVEAVTAGDVRRAGESDRETLRRRAANAGPIHEDTLVYRVEFHAV